MWRDQQHTRVAMVRVTEACGLLEQHGCRIEAASAHARPFIRVDRAPPRWPEEPMALAGIRIVWRH
jgi:hypothetical protein